MSLTWFPPPLPVSQHPQMMMKKPLVSRSVHPSEGLSVDGGMMAPSMGSYTATLDRYRQAVPADYPTATVPRNYHYGPPAGYDDYRPGPPSEAYSSMSRGTRMDDRYRWAPSNRHTLFLLTL